jgi:Flp pilus assembly pilin Flp
VAGRATSPDRPRDRPASFFGPRNRGETVGKILTAVRRFLASKDEAAAIGEYAVALMLIGIAALAGVTLLGTKLSAFFVQMAQSI